MTIDFLVTYCVKAEFLLILNLPSTNAYPVLPLVSSIAVGIKLTKQSFDWAEKSISLMVVIPYICDEPLWCGSRWTRHCGYKNECVIIQVFKDLVFWEGQLCKQIIIIQQDQVYDGSMNTVPQELGGDAQRTLYKEVTFQLGLVGCIGVYQADKMGKVILDSENSTCNGGMKSEASWGSCMCFGGAEAEDAMALDEALREAGAWL